MYFYHVKAELRALEDIAGGDGVSFFSRRLSQWAGVWTFAVITSDRAALLAWLVRSVPAIHSWQEVAYNEASHVGPDLAGNGGMVFAFWRER
jgi:hypothetical protein